MVPDAVVRELTLRPGAPGSEAPRLEFVERLSPDPANVDLVAAGTPSIEAGEREVIALALGTGATAVMDDRRSRGRRLGIPLTGTLGVLAALHYAGQAHQSFEQDLDTLDQAGMYLTDDLRRRVVDRFRTGPGGI
jgi:predicted nucleic acid-binding protein